MNGAEVAGELAGVRFTLRYQGGYDMAQVDRVLDQLASAAVRGDDLGAILERLELDIVRWRAAYDRKEVDRFLKRMTEIGRTEPAPVAERHLGEVLALSNYGDLVEAITTARFTPVRLHEGYDMGDVDRLLDEIVAALGRGDSVTRLIDDRRVTHVRLREGYDIAEVDRFLASLRATVQSPTDAGASLPTVIHEEQGFFRRILDRL